ncbi:MAG: hypothetical protein J6S71_10020 [Clostridia bacterium]|nr:hypothetical protein [Clostridia bacterium]
MIKFHDKYNFLWLSILIAAGVAFMQIWGNTVGLTLIFILFGVLIVLATAKDMAIPLLIFFLPWSPLIKFAPGSTSMYTISLVAVLMIFLLRSSKKFAVMHIFPAALLFVLTIIVKTVTDSPIDGSYILFLMCMILFPLATNEKGRRYDFYMLVVFFSLGIITAALSARWLVIFPNIARYIDVIEYSSLTRLSGYYGDPNFYSAHITAAIGGAILLLLNETKIIRKIVVYLMIAVLLYCGFLSVSKSFALILVCMLLLWVIEVLFKRGRLSSKVTMLLALLIGGVYILTSILFTDLLDMMMERFVGAGSSLSELTTRRSDLWINYLRMFEENPLVLLFGKGYTEDLVNGRGSHNIVIQMVYQFGLVGTLLTLVWFYEYCKIVLRTVRLKMEHIVQLLLMIGGTFGPWLGLDLLMFDEFFILPFFVFLGILYLNKEDGEESAESVIPDEVAE